jgi:hypothetical protein
MQLSLSARDIFSAARRANRGGERGVRGVGREGGEGGPRPRRIADGHRRALAASSLAIIIIYRIPPSCRRRRRRRQPRPIRACRAAIPRARPCVSSCRARRQRRLARANRTEFRNLSRAHGRLSLCLRYTSVPISRPALHRVTSRAVRCHRHERTGACNKFPGNNKSGKAKWRAKRRSIARRWKRRGKEGEEDSPSVRDEFPCTANPRDKDRDEYHPPSPLRLKGIPGSFVLEVVIKTFARKKREGGREGGREGDPRTFEMHERFGVATSLLPTPSPPPAPASLELNT